MAFKLNDYNAFLTSLYEKNGDTNMKTNNGSPSSIPSPLVKQEFPVDFDFGLSGEPLYKDEIEDNILGDIDNPLIKPENKLFQASPLNLSPQLIPSATVEKPDIFLGDVLKNSSISTADTFKTISHSPVSNATSPYPDHFDEGHTFQDPSFSLDEQLASQRSSSIVSASNHSSRPRVKSSHNVIEQRYRNKINDKFTALQESVPTLRIVSRRKKRVTDDKNSRHYDDDEDDDKLMSSDLSSSEMDNLEGLEPARKLNKGTILAKSIEYIKFLELKNDRMRAEREALIEKAKLMGLSVSQDLLN